MNEKHLMNILNTSAKSLKNLKPKYLKMAALKRKN
jgi:hypothetical protein